MTLGSSEVRKRLSDIIHVERIQVVVEVPCVTTTRSRLTTGNFSKSRQEVVLVVDNMIASTTSLSAAHTCLCVCVCM